MGKEQTDTFAVISSERVKRERREERTDDPSQHEERDTPDRQERDETLKCQPSCQHPGVVQHPKDQKSGVSKPKHTD